MRIYISTSTLCCVVFPNLISRFLSCTGARYGFKLSWMLLETSLFPYFIYNWIFNWKLPIFLSVQRTLPSQRVITSWFLPEIRIFQHHRLVKFRWKTTWCNHGCQQWTRLLTDSHPQAVQISNGHCLYNLFLLHRFGISTVSFDPVTRLICAEISYS